MKLYSKISFFDAFQIAIVKNAIDKYFIINNFNLHYLLWIKLKKHQHAKINIIINIINIIKF